MLEKYAKEYRAMFTWFRQNFENNPKEGAEYILAGLMFGDNDCVFWQFLEATGGGNIDREKLMEISNLMIDAAKKQDNNL